MHLPAMKQFIFSILATVGMFSFISCERHNWEDSADGKKDGTKNLFPKEEKKHDDAKHADDHPSHEGHGH